MKKKLAIIGASYLQEPLVLKAKEMGVHTICFAWADGAVCKDTADEFFPISIIEKEKICSICKEKKVDGVTTIATDVAVPTVCYVADELNLIGNSVQSAYISTNKYAMRQTLASAGASCPGFALIKSYSDALNALNKISFPLIVKPCDRSGSIGVTKISNVDELKAAIETALTASFCGEAVMEEFIENAREISIEGISWKGEHYVLAITDKVTTGPPHYVELGHHQPSNLPKVIVDKAIKQVKLGIKALGIEYGASHPELMITPDGQVYLTEIGARMGGDFIGSDLVYLSTGYDFLKGVIEVALGNFTTPVFKEQKYSGVWFYSPDTPKVKDIILNKADYTQVIRTEIHDEELKPLSRSADRAGYFIYCGDAKMDIKEDTL